MRSSLLLLAIGIAAFLPELVQAKEAQLKKTTHGFLKPATQTNSQPLTYSRAIEKNGLQLGFLARIRELARPAGQEIGGYFFWGVLLVMFCCGGSCQAFAYLRSTGSPLDWDEGLEDASTQDVYGNSITLKQQMAAVELFGIEAKNRYLSEEPPLYIHEKSDGIQRVLASANRELTLFAHAGGTSSAPKLLRMYKPWHCSGCECFINPSMTVDSPGGKVGSIDDPFDCCSMNQQILDAAGDLRFKVEGSRYQTGTCCPCCADTQFDVIDKDNKPVATIVKPALNFGEVFMHTNRFTVNFPEQCTMNDKALLVGSAMLLDLQYFDVKQ